MTGEVGTCVTGHMLNGQTLLEFPHPHTSEGEGAVLRVKTATLWVKVRAVEPLSYGRVPDRNMTLWIFRVAPSQLRNATYLNGKVSFAIKRSKLFNKHVA